MQVSTITEKGQITIPKTIRKALHLDSSRRIIFIQRGDEILIKAVPDFLALFGVLEANKTEKDWETIRQQAREDRLKQKGVSTH